MGTGKVDIEMRSGQHDSRRYRPLRVLRFCLWMAVPLVTVVLLLAGSGATPGRIDGESFPRLPRVSPTPRMGPGNPIPERGSDAAAEERTEFHVPFKNMPDPPVPQERGQFFGK